MLDYAIDMNGVAKTYAEPRRPPIRALSDCNLRVPRGEIFCLVGPSGCGKTTVLNLVAGFTPPSHGTITLHGAPVRGPHSHCGIVFQEDAVFPWMTVAANVGYSLRRTLPPDARREAVGRYLRLVGLETYAQRWPRELSGGMRKRIDVARAYAAGRPTLLLDEPFASLDVLTKADMHELLLRAWRAERKSVLFVTHDVEEAVFLGHRVGVMSPRPGYIRHVARIPFSYSERTAQLRLDSRFIDVRRSLYDCMNEK